jgi:putative transposase
VSPADLAIMRRIDELHLEHPFAGSRMLRDVLHGEGVEVGCESTSTADPYRRPVDPASCN